MTADLISKEGISTFLKELETFNSDIYIASKAAIDKAVTDDSQFKIYPNPATTKLYVATPDNKNIKSIKVTNLSGHCVLLIENPSSPIDVNQLNEGYYILTIFDENDNLYNKSFLKFFN